MDVNKEERPRFLFKIFPPWLLYLIPKAVGAAFFYARPGMRRRLQAKIKDGIPEITDPRELARIGRQVCAAVFMPTFDIFTLVRHGDRYMRELKVIGMENVEKAEAQGKGVIFTGVHVGAITIIHAVSARLGKAYTPIAFNPADTPMPRYIEALEFYSGLAGCDVEEPVFFVGENIIPKVGKHLSAGKRVGLTFDVDGNFVVDFFARPAAMASGVAHFSYDSGAPIVSFTLQRGKNPFDNRIIFFEPIFSDPSADRKSEIARLMREVARDGEEIIRMVPGQWISWFGLWKWWEDAQKIMQRKETAGSPG
jgi:lauroyl/myristoyl acyltransferase